MGPSVSGHHPSYLRKRWIRQRADKEKKEEEASSTFVLVSAITSMCTYYEVGHTNLVGKILGHALVHLVTH
jgi:hypothetical protein